MRAGCCGDELCARWCSTQHACKAADGPLTTPGVPPWGTADCTRSHPSFDARSPRLTPQHCSAPRRLGEHCERHYAVVAGMRRRRMSSRKNYPPAPLVVATTASGAKVDGHVRICHGAFVGAPLAWLWLWRWLGWTERCNTAQCIDANMLSSRAWRKLHFCCMSVAQSMLHATCCMLHASCCMLHAQHAACCMMHLARKANGSTWRAEGTSPISHVASRLLCAGPAEHSLRWSCRTCQ